MLATHNAEEAFELCDRVAVLDHGRLLASGAAHQLARDHLGVRYRVLTTDPLHAAFQDLSSRGVWTIVSTAPAEGDGGWIGVTIRLGAQADADAVLASLVGSGARVAGFEPLRPSLADLIEGVVSRGEGR